MSKNTPVSPDTNSTREIKTRMEIPDEQLHSLRGRCVQNVKKTSGSVTLDGAVRYQRGVD